MPEYLAPGVFVEEIDNGSKPIEGVGTNTVAFVGFAKSGDFNTPTFISNWTQFCQSFGEEENALVRALSDELGITGPEVVAAKRASRKGWIEYAQTAVQSAIRERPANAKGSKSWQDFLRTHQIPMSGLPYAEGSYLAHTVRGYYDNGGGRAYIVRIPRRQDVESLLYKVNGQADSKKLAPPPPLTIGPYTFKAAKTAADPVQIEVEHVGDGEEFRIKLSQGDASESYGYGKDKPLTPDGLAQALTRSKLVDVQTADAATMTRPEARIYTIEAASLVPVAASGAPESLSVSALAALKAEDFIGDEAQRTGVNGLALLDDVNAVCVPDLMAGLYQRQSVNGNGGPAVETLALNDARRQAILDAQCAVVAYCERSADRMAILDPLPGLTPQQMRDTTLNTPYNCDHGQAAIYYPWIRITDPMRRGQQMMCPPCGHVAGVWVRAAVERGVHKAPANEALLGAVALEVGITKGEQEILNPEGINAIRAFPGTGIRIWGARTLATVGNPSWKYVNVRRLFNYLEKSMERGLQWVVFEPNDSDLWGRVRRNIAAFLWTEWKEGKLFGTTAAEAFYVKCDSETNPQEMIDLGRLYVEIGVNPVKPAEFVIVRIGQWSASSSIAEA